MTRPVTPVSLLVLPVPRPVVLGRKVTSLYCHLFVHSVPVSSRVFFYVVRFHFLFLFPHPLLETCFSWSLVSVLLASVLLDPILVRSTSLIVSGSRTPFSPDPFEPRRSVPPPPT